MDIIGGRGLGSYLVATLGGSAHFFRFCFHFWRILAPFWVTLAPISSILGCFVSGLLGCCFVSGLLVRWVLVVFLFFWGGEGICFLACWFVGLLCCGVLGFLDSWFVGLLCFWVVGLLDGLVVPWLLGCWVVGLVGWWVVELDCWIVGLLYRRGLLTRKTRRF